MSKVLIDNRIHNDAWFFSLEPQLKYVFFFLISNGYCNLVGAYEIPIQIIATYISSTIGKTKEILKKLEPRVFYKNGWIVIPNYQKWNPMRNPSIKIALKRQLADIPVEIRECIQGGARVWTDPKETETEKERVLVKKGGVGGNKPPLKKLEQICSDYQVPMSFVESKWDDLMNYCGAKGKRYKDYYLTLRGWVKKDAIQLRKEQYGQDDKKAAIDAEAILSKRRMAGES